MADYVYFRATHELEAFCVEGVEVPVSLIFFLILIPVICARDWVGL